MEEMDGSGTNQAEAPTEASEFAKNSNVIGKR
jgi:hypothetical protein